jgi:CRISPR-associated DxTHG motif protein
MECRYKYSREGEEKISDAAVYAQCAIAELMGAEWTDAYVFTTKAAYAKHFEKLNACWPRPGVKLEPVEIPDGKGEAEIWSIFEIILGKLQNGDEVWLDITHGFRSLPFIAGSLIQYAKIINNIDVKAILYGAYEAKAPLEGGAGIAPIFDMSAFSTILDWSSAANNFIHFGYGTQIKALTDKSIVPILKETSGKDKTAASLNKLSKNLNSLCLELRTCRGGKLIKGSSSANVLEAIDSLQKDNGVIPALNPLFAKIRESVASMEQSPNDVRNMLTSVQWCLDKHLIQEGLTLLDEGVISYFMGGRYNEYGLRDYVSAYMAQYGDKAVHYDDSRFRKKFGD